MDDLQVLNKRILSHSGTPNDNIEKVLELISVCLGKLKPSGQALSDFIGLIAQQTNENPLDVVSINKEFLQFARQTARDVTSGYFDGLIVLNIDFAQARVLARLTNQQITDVSRRWDGLVFEPAGATSLQVQHLHESAAPHYSVALLAAAA